MRTIYLVLASQLLLSAAAPSISFFARRDTPITGPSLEKELPPTAIAIADFNGDGLPDVALVSEPFNGITIYINKGGGEFKGGSVIDAGLSPDGVVAGDFNGDGKQDLAVVSLEGTGIMLGNGDGTFQPLVNIRPAFGSVIATGDFNGDGKLDLVTGYIDSNVLGLMLGNGNGTFQPIVTVAATTNASALAVADLNGDGRPDLLVVNNKEGEILTILNTGNGTFSPPAVFSVPGATTVTTGDFNNDGNIDVACAALVDGASNLFLLLGDGNGQLAPPVTVASEGNPTGMALVAAGDFNGDGNLDLVGALNSYTGSYTIVMLGNGDGAFQPSTSYEMGGPVLLGVADFNNDGKLDILTANSNINLSLMSVLLGKGNGDFEFAPETALTNFTAGASPATLAAADLNGDGFTDFVAAESTGVQVLLGEGVDQLKIGQFIKVSLTDIALADVNGDGHADMIMTTGGADVGVYLGNGDGTFQAPLKSNAGGPQAALAIGDFNGDGKPDVAIIVNAQLGVMLGDGTGNFAAPAALFALGSDPDYISVGDFNNDGKLDAVVSYTGVTGVSPSGILVFLGNGDGTFQPSISLPIPAGAYPWDVHVADLNGDGNLDIVSSNNNETYMSIYLGNGDGTFQTPTTAYCGFAPQHIVVMDFNGDGIPDIAFESEGDQDIGVMAGNGDGTFTSPAFFGAGPFPRSIAAGTLAQGAKPALVLIDSEFGGPVGYTVLRNISK